MFKKLIQVGFVSRELSRVLDNFVNIYNIGPWYLLKFSPENVKSMSVYGKKKKYSMNVAVCPIGDTRFEYIEPITESIFSDFYDIYGEKTFHHLKFGVNSYREALRFLDLKNIETIQVGNQQGDAGKNMINFLLTQKEFGFITEIVYVTKNFIKPKPDFWFPEGRNDYKPIFIKPSIIGIVTKNIENRIKKYEEFGIGPWQVKNFGRESDLKIKAKMAFCRLENIILKLIEPQSDSIFYEHLLKHGEGIHHLKMEISDYAMTLKYLLSKGLNIIYSDSYQDKINFSYLDTDKHINFIVEISDQEIKNELQPEMIMHP
jgi:methylmalonyl-CoA/ethylmalonyl-CoA epimerase